MKTYSLDLRQKIVDAYAVGSISQRKLARNLNRRSTSLAETEVDRSYG